MLVDTVFDIKASDTSGYVAIMLAAFSSSFASEDNKLYGVVTPFLVIIQLKEGPTRVIVITKGSV